MPRLIHAVVCKRIETDPETGEQHYLGVANVIHSLSLPYETDVHIGCLVEADEDETFECRVGAANVGEEWPPPLPLRTRKSYPSTIEMKAGVRHLDLIFPMKFTEGIWAITLDLRPKGGRWKTVARFPMHIYEMPYKEAATWVDANIKDEKRAEVKDAIKLRNRLRGLQKRRQRRAEQMRRSDGD